MKKISEIKKKNITKIDTFFLSRNNPFGNNLPCINNAIFYCEILGCNKIILREKKIRRRWLIKNITITNLNITITQGPDVNCNEEGMLCSYETWDLLYPIIVIHFLVNSCFVIVMQKEKIQGYLVNLISKLGHFMFLFGREQNK